VLADVSSQLRVRKHIMQEIVPMNCSIYEQQFLVECEIRRKNRIFSGPIDTLWLKKKFKCRRMA
jgi:hypothetical protein